ARAPFESTSGAVAVGALIVGAPPTPIAAHRPDVPEALVAIVARCLEKDPANRYANAGELGAALEQAAASLGVPIPAISSVSSATGSFPSSGRLAIPTDKDVSTRIAPYVGVQAGAPTAPVERTAGTGVTVESQMSVARSAPGRAAAVI